MGKKKKKKVVLDEKPSFDNPFAALKETLDLPDDGIELTDQDLGPPPFDRSTLKFRLRKEKKKRGGKVVTLIDGSHEVPEEERDDFLKYIKTALGVGAFWDGDILAVQGDIAERLSPVLTAWKSED